MARYLLVRRAAIPFDVIVNFDSGTAGDPVSASVMNASTHGAGLPGTWTTPSSITHTEVANHAITLPFSISVDGVTYDGTSGKGLTFDQSDDAIDSDSFSYQFSNPEPTDLITLVVARWDLSGGTDDYNNDIVDIEWGGFAVSQMDYHGADHFLLPHTSAGVGGRTMVYTNGTWIVIVSKLTAAGVFETYMLDQATGALLWASRTVLNTPPTEFVTVFLTDYLRNASQPNGWVGDIRVKTFVMRASDLTFPVNTLSIDAPSSVVAAQTAESEVTVTITTVGSYVQIERNLNSGGFAVLEAGIDIGTTGEYVDTDLSDGDVAIYRATLLIGSQSSAASSSSNTVTVDDAPFNGTWQDTIAPGSTDSTNLLDAGFTIMSKLTVSGGGTCGRLRVWNVNGGAAGNVKLALYDNSSPKVLLGQTAAVSVLNGSSYTEADLVSVVAGLTNGQVVWVGFHPDTTNGLHARYLNGGGNNSVFTGESYATFPTGTFTGSDLARHYAASAYIY